MRVSKSYEMNMCEGAILPKMLKFAVPLMLSSILQLLFNAADVVVVGEIRLVAGGVVDGCETLWSQTGGRAEKKRAYVHAAVSTRRYNTDHSRGSFYRRNPGTYGDS